MTGETLRDLLKPLIRRSGSISMTVRGTGQIGFALDEGKRLTGIKLEPDGLVRLERSGAGWIVIDPSEVATVAWTSDAEDPAGQFL